MMKILVSICKIVANLLFSVVMVGTWFSKENKLDSIYLMVIAIGMMMMADQITGDAKKN